MILDGVEEWGWRSERCGRRDLCDGQQFFVVSQSVEFFFVFMCIFEQCLMGSNPDSACFVRCMCTLKYYLYIIIIIIIIIIYTVYVIPLNSKV